MRNTCELMTAVKGIGEKPAKVALIAVANRLIQQIFAVVTKQNRLTMNFI